MSAPNGEQARRTTGEAVTTVVAGLLLLAFVTLIVWEGYGAGRDDPASVRVELDAGQADKRGEAWYVPYTVTNDGDVAIGEVLIAFEALREGETVDESDTTITQLGEDERVEGELVLEEDPATLELSARAQSFQIVEQ